MSSAAPAFIAPGTTTNGLKFPDLYEASVMELQAGLDAGLFTSVDLVEVNHFSNR